MQLTKFATKLYGTNIMSALFDEHRYFNFQDEIQFFFKYNNGILKHRDSESFRGCNRPISCCSSLASYYLHNRSSLMSWHNIIFTFFSNLLSRQAPNARSGRRFHGFQRQLWTTLSISDANVCITAWKRVDVTLNICCNIVTGTCLIWAS